MKLFVILKPFHILLIWITLLFAWIFTFNSPLYYLTFGLAYTSAIGWVYLVGKIFNGLNNKTRIENYREDFWFILTFISFIPNIYFFKHTDIQVDLRNVLLIIFNSINCLGLFKTLNFATKSYRQFETGLNLTFIKYFMYFLMFCYFFIAVFFVQPKINRIFKLNK